MAYLDDAMYIDYIFKNSRARGTYPMMEFKFRWQTRKRLSKITVGFVEDDELQLQFAAFRSRYSRPRVLSGLCLLANGSLSITITILPFPVAEKVLVKRTNMRCILRYSR